jgi:hypothetical protein
MYNEHINFFGPCFVENLIDITNDVNLSDVQI